MLAITKEMNKLRIIYSLLFLLLLFGIMQFGIGRIYGPMLFPDEIGYWGTAAAMKGYDWSEITSLGSYYSYGYGILLYPIVSLGCSAVWMYRIAVFLNFILLCIGFLLLYQILKKVCPKKDESVLLFFSMGGILYSSWIFSMQVALSEILLMSLYLLIVYLFIRYLEEPKKRTAFLLAGAFVYLYFVHMRTVGIVIAGGITLLLLAVFGPKYRRPILIVFISGIICMLIGIWGKEFMMHTLYQTTDQSNIALNTYNGQWYKFLELVTFEGLWKLLISCIGKLFYLGISTFGLFYYGIYYLIKKVIQTVKNRFDSNMIFIFLLLSILGQFAVSALYMSGGEYIDNVLYGRYNEIFLPVVMCLGMAQLLETKNLLPKTLLLALIQGIFAFMIVEYGKHFELLYRHSCFISGVNYATNRWDFNLDSFLAIVLLVGTVLYFITTGVFLLIKKDKQWYWLLSILLLLQLAIGLKASKDYVYLHNSYNYEDIMLGQDIKELGKQGKEIYFSASKESTEYIGLLQYVLMENTIHLIPQGKEAEYLSQDNVVITYKTNEQLEIFRDNYQEEAESTHFYAFYNER